MGVTLERRFKSHAFSDSHHDLTEKEKDSLERQDTNSRPNARGYGLPGSVNRELSAPIRKVHSMHSRSPSWRNTIIVPKCNTSGVKSKVIVSQRLP